ncbi:restriction endonuclease subunit S [Corynebacterium sp. USCH3]|uniref:restriction endonuclease subunit S n=1 Tax=Corynebacterium sp. USCH3 TaxID=3024840 RepID=UPI00309FE482
MTSSGRTATRWPELALRRIGKIVNGGTPRAEGEFWDGGIPFITPPDLRPVLGATVFDTERTLSAAGVRAGSSVVPAGSVILSIRAPIGYVARTSSDSAFNQGCRAIVPTVDHDSRFLTYALMGSSDFLNSIGRGTTFMEVSSAQLSEVRLPAPPLDDQRAIADYLDRETQKIDKLITEQRDLIETLRERRKSVIDQGAEESVAERIRLRYLFFPAEVRNQHGEQVLSVYRDYGVIPKGSREDNYNVTPEDVSRYLLVRPGDLVVNRMKAWQGSLGISQHRGIVSGDYEVLRPTTERLHPMFAHLYLRSARMVGQYVVRSTGIRPSQWRMYWKQMGDIAIPVPPIRKQQEIVSFVSEQISRIDELISESEELIDLSQERRAALITAAVTGQIDVREEA